MKRCPQCHRVETDNALAFCRADGTALVSDSASLKSEAGTAKLGSVSAASEVERGVLSHTTDSAVKRGTAPPPMLPAGWTPGTTRELSKPKRGRFVLALIALVIVGVAIAGYFYFSRIHKAAIESIAVMPFVNESGNADTEYLSDGMTETLISSLSQLPSLSVKPRSSVFRYKGKETNSQTIAKDLNVQAILNGRVVQRGQDVSLYVELIDVALDKVVWSQQYSRRQTDLVTLQTDNRPRCVG
jgi:TolB-like protein